MPAPSTTEEFLDLVRKSGVVEEKRLDAYLEKVRATGLQPSPSRMAGVMERDGILTHFQAEQIVQGKWRRFTIGKYKVLERLGSGGMGSVYLCEHKLMRRRVAVKVLPTAKADDPSSLERFYREARAVAALDHPNIVRAYDIDQDEKLHFLVMEYVDGSSLQEIIKKTGPMSVLRACHYMQQSALGIQHAYETAGLVHRDIKPGNILVDRSGIVKVLDMGLARFFNDEEDNLTKKYDENVLGTADYLAPEQAIDSHGVDIRADIYSLGATFYFVLTGRTPFTEGTVAQKLIWHQTRQPKSIRQVRPDVPDEVVTLIERMMAKDPAQRPSTPREIADALAPLTQTPIGPPPEEEMPTLSPAALGVTANENPAPTIAPTPSAGGPSSGQRKSWKVASNPASSGTSPAVKPAPAPPAGKPSPRPQAMSRPSQAISKSTGSVNQAQRTTAGTATKQPEPKTTAVSEEEEAWDQVAAETTKSTSRANTPPRQPRKSAPAPRRVGGTTRDGLPDRRRVWIVVGIATAVVLFLVVVAGVVGFLLARRVEANPPDKPAPRSALKVGKDAKYKTLAEAWRNAIEGDHIIVQGPLLEENLQLDGQDARQRNITIEPEDPGAPFTWRPNPNAKDVSHLLALKNVEGLHLRGVTFDGADRCGKSVLLLTGHCPGTSLEDIRIQGFSGSGVMFVNCEGDPTQPLTLSKAVIVASPGKPAHSAWEFDLKPSLELVKRNQFLTLRDCRIEGIFEASIRLSETARGKDSESKERTSVSLERVVAIAEAGKDPEVVTLPP
jgi:serine/threonine protein kinase